MYLVTAISLNLFMYVCIVTILLVGPPLWTIQSRSICHGHDIETEVAANIEECMARCISMSGCAGLLFRDDNKYCYLKRYCSPSAHNGSQGWTTALFG